MMRMRGGEPILPLQRAVIIIGNYGSGKTEVAVNWALNLRKWGVEDVSIADLDVVNPYFRTREAVDVLEQEGIRVVIPRGAHFYADLPIILPEIRGMFEVDQGIAIFDVGGDPVGARVLGSFADVIREHEMLQVVNHNRPFTDTVEGTMELQHKMEETSGLKVTGYIGNSHLLEETDVDTILAGYEFLKELSSETGVPIRFITIPEQLADSFPYQEVDVPVMRLRRILRPPWDPEQIIRGGKPMLQV